MFHSLREILGSPTCRTTRGSHGSTRRPELEVLEDRTVPAIIVGSGPGGGVVEVFDDRTQALITSFTPFAGFTGGINVAVGNFNADNIPDYVVAVAGNGTPHVKVIDGATRAELASFFAYDERFTGGVNVAVGDVDNDGRLDVITGVASNGTPHVRVFSGLTQTVIRSFFAFTTGFTGGVNVAAGNINGVGGDDIVVSVARNGTPHVKVFDALTLNEIRSFFAYTQNFLGGVNIDTGNVFGDALDEIITGTGPGGSPHVKVFNGTTLAELDSFFAYDQAVTSGVRVSRVDVNGDGREDLLTVPQNNARAHVRAFSLFPRVERASFYALGTTTNGANISGS